MIIRHLPKCTAFLAHGFIVLLLLCGVSNLAQGQTKKPDWRARSDNKGFTFYQVQQDFYQFWAGKVVQKEGDLLLEGESEDGYDIFKRWEAYMAPRVYPSGNLNLPSMTYENYVTWQKKHLVSDRSPSGNWTELGPFGKPGGPITATGAGRVNFIRFDPNDVNHIFVGGPDGGLWSSTNGGASWTTQNDFLTIIGCSDLAIDPNNSNIMYLATGDIERVRNSIGILKSTDGGQTWNTTGLVWTQADNYKPSKLLMQPGNSSVMLFSTDGGVFRTTDGWATYTNNFCCDDLKDMEFKPGDPNIVYASGKKFFRSVDHGDHFSEVTTGLPPTADISRIALGVSPANPAYVYALIGKSSNQSFLGLYRSTDSGVSFSLRASTPNLLGYEPNGLDTTSGQAFYDLAIAISPLDAEKVITAGVNQWGSLDGGTTWNVITNWNADGGLPFVHADVHEVIFLPGSNTTFFSCNDGGIFKTTNNGVNWTDISSNLALNQNIKIGLSASNPDMYITGTQDNGTNLHRAAPWTNIFGGDGGECFFDYSDISNNTIYLSYVNADYNRSDDGGVTTQSIKMGLPSGADFYSTWHQDPGTPTTLYTGGYPALYKSLNKGDLWTISGTPSGTGTIQDLAISASNNTVLYAIKYDAISKSTDSGATWTNVTGTLPVANASLSNLAISSTDPNKVWVTFSGYSDGNKVFKTTDGGTTWTNISTGLPNIPMNVVVPVNGSAIDAIYIGADIGVYYEDNTLACIPFKTNLPNNAVRDLEIYYPTARLRAGTFGRGMWESNLYTGAQPVSLAIKVFLQGPYNVGAGTMNDDLRAGNYIPTADPNSAFGFGQVLGEIEGTNTSVLNVTGNNAIVDWVFVELRDKNNPATRLYTRSALVQRDGDVVEMDGVSPLHFSNASPDNYYVAVRHRNHLGFRTLNAIALSGTTTNLNFTNNTIPTFGTEALKEIAPGIYGMYSGDANRDGNVNAADKNANWRPQNGGTYNYLTSTADFDLNGAVNAVDRNAQWRPNNSRVQQLD